MKPEYLLYTKRLGAIGEATQETADLFGLLSKRKDATVEEYNKANKGYIKCRQDVLKIVPPSEVKMEHKEIVNGYQMMIDSVDIMISSISVNSDNRDEQKFHEGISLMNGAIRTVESAANKIVKKS